MEAICDVRTEVRNYGEDSQAHMQDLAYQLQLILEWCEGAALLLQILPPLLLEGLHLDVPILMSSIPGAMTEETP